MADAARPCDEVVFGLRCRHGFSPYGLSCPAPHDNLPAPRQISIGYIPGSAYGLINGHVWTFVLGKFIGIGRCIEGAVEAGHLTRIAIISGDKTLVGDCVFAVGFVVFDAVQDPVDDAVEAGAGSSIELGVNFPSPEGWAT